MSLNFDHKHYVPLVEMRYLVEKNRINAMVLMCVEQELDEPDPMIIATSIDRTISRRCCCVRRDATDLWIFRWPD